MKEGQGSAAKVEKLRARRIDNKMKLVAVLAVVAVALIVGVVFLVRGSGGGSYNTGSLKSGFPRSVDSLSGVNYIYASKNNIVILNNNLLEIVSAGRGATLKSATHFFANPVADVNSKYILTYDQGKTKYRIDTQSNIICEGESEKNIFTACIAPNGVYAISAAADKGNSDITVYSKNLKELFTWNSSSGYIIEMCLSNDGKRLAACAVSSQDAQLKSTVYVFDVGKKKLASQLEFPGIAISEIKYVNGNDFYVLAGNFCAFVSDGEKSSEIVPAGDMDISSYSFNEKGHLAMICSKYTSDTSSSLICYDAAGKKLFESAMKEPVKDVFASAGAYSVLLSDSVVSYNKDGEIDSTADAGRYSSDFVRFASDVYLLDVDEIRSESLEVTK